jgi:hypothetical protein
VNSSAAALLAISAEQSGPAAELQVGKTNPHHRVAVVVVTSQVGE